MRQIWLIVLSCSLLRHLHASRFTPVDLERRKQLGQLLTNARSPSLMQDLIALLQTNIPLSCSDTIEDDPFCIETPLQVAIRHNVPLQAIALFIDKVDINRKGKMQRAAIHNVYNVPLLQLLLSKNADPLVQDQYEKTALICFIEKSSVVLVSNLIASCPPLLHIPDWLGDMPLHHAVRLSDEKYTEELHHLLSYQNVKTNAVNKEGNTALHVALNKKNPSTRVIKLLLDAGASMFIRNKAKQTPFSLIHKIKDKVLQELLEKYAENERHIRLIVLQFALYCKRNDLKSSFVYEAIFGRTPHDLCWTIINSPQACRWLNKKLKPTKFLRK